MLNYHELAPIAMCLQLADQTIRYPAGIAENIPVKIRNFFIPVDFVVLDMEVDAKTLVILGGPFLSTAKAHIDVGAGEIQLNINGQKERFAFRPINPQANGCRCSFHLRVFQGIVFILREAMVKEVDR